MNQPIIWYESKSSFISYSRGGLLHDLIFPVILQVPVLLLHIELFVMTLITMQNFIKIESLNTIC